MAPTYRIGADENGLGARLGPLVVTGVIARVDERGQKLLARRPPKRFAHLLGDSKALVCHGDVAIGEAWARALAPCAETPAELFGQLSLEGQAYLREPCPDHVMSQCWSVAEERFVADPALLQEARALLDYFRSRGVEVLSAKSSVLCTERLNRAKHRGHNRFVADLHAMEALVLAFRREVGVDVTAVCGKVGGMGDYPRFFGPLAGWLFAVIAQGRKRSSYRFPGLGELHFVQDADARDALVMLASLVGKYVRELLMARVARFYAGALELLPDQYPSGYNDPVTGRFVDATRLVRGRRGVPDTCFERARAEEESAVVAGATAEREKRGAAEIRDPTPNAQISLAGELFR